MIEIGCTARFFNPFEQEVRFAKENGFSFFQIWYDREGLQRKDIEEQTKLIKEYGFPSIIHAVLDINEIEEHVIKLIKVLKDIGHRELIIHPVCKSETITEDTIYKLAEKVKVALDRLTKEGIVLYLENNSKLDPVFTSTREIEIMFATNPQLEFLLDIAHIDDYDHLKEMISIRRPSVLHIADRHLEVVHEHLPLGQGNIDYQYIFKDILSDFEGKIILEIVQSDQDILASKELLESYIAEGKSNNHV